MTDFVLQYEPEPFPKGKGHHLLRPLTEEAKSWRENQKEGLGQYSAETVGKNLRFRSDTDITVLIGEIVKKAGFTLALEARERTYSLEDIISALKSEGLETEEESGAQSLFGDEGTVTRITFQKKPPH